MIKQIFLKSTKQNTLFSQQRGDIITDPAEE